MKRFGLNTGVLNSYFQLILLIKNDRSFWIRPKDIHIFSLTFLSFFHMANFNQKVSDLKKNLDGASCQVVDKILFRYNLISQYNVIKRDLVIDSFDHKLDRLIHSSVIKSISKYYVPDNYVEPPIFYYKYGLCFIDNLKKPFGNVIDAGAFVGDSCVLFNDCLKPAKIFAFEPDEINFSKLKYCINRNSFDNVVPINCALGEKTGNVKIKNQGVVSCVSSSGQNAKLLSIDEFVETNNIAVDLIKMDIEGYEYNAIVGAQKTIQKHKPILLISIYHTAKDFFEIKPFLEKIVPEYRFKIVHLNYEHPIVDTILIAYV